MEKIIVENLDKPESNYKAMYVISPAGDTLNKDEALMEAVVKPEPTEVIPQTAAKPMKDK